MLQKSTIIHFNGWFVHSLSVCGLWLETIFISNISDSVMLTIWTGVWVFTLDDNTFFVTDFFHLTLRLMADSVGGFIRILVWVWVNSWFGTKNFSMSFITSIMMNWSGGVLALVVSASKMSRSFSCSETSTSSFSCSKTGTSSFSWNVNRFCWNGCCSGNSDDGKESNSLLNDKQIH